MEEILPHIHYQSLTEPGTTIITYFYSDLGGKNSQRMTNLKLTTENSGFNRVVRSIFLPICCIIPFLCLERPAVSSS